MIVNLFITSQDNEAFTFALKVCLESYEHAEDIFDMKLIVCFYVSFKHMFGKVWECKRYNF